MVVDRANFYFSAVFSTFSPQLTSRRRLHWFGGNTREMFWKKCHRRLCVIITEHFFDGRLLSDLYRAEHRTTEQIDRDRPGVSVLQRILSLLRRRVVCSCFLGCYVLLSSTRLFFVKRSATVRNILACFDDLTSISINQKLSRSVLLCTEEFC